MNSEPLVSIILPTYNRADLLPSSIGSVIAQDYDNWELLIWDDGSTDSTRAVVDTFSDSRIRYFRQGNAGMSYALNQAMAAAKGQYVAFLDDDDQWMAQKLSSQVRVLERFKAIDVLFTDFVNVHVSTGEERQCFEQNAVGFQSITREEVADGVFMIRDGIPASILKANFIGFDTVIVRDHVMRATGGFNERLRNSQDTELWWRMGLAGVRFGYVDTVAMKRIKHAGSLSSPSLTTYQNYLQCLDSCHRYTVTHGRRDLMPLIHGAYHQAWLGVSRQYALANDRSNAIKAFTKAMQYGVSWSAGYTTLQVLAGADLADRIRRLVRGVKNHGRPV